VATLAFAVRLAAVFAVGSFRLEHVTYEHGEIARNLVEGHGFVVRWMGAEGPTSQQAPVYPALVAVFYFLFGIETPAALLALQVFQCLLGAMMAAGAVLLASEILPEQPVAQWLAGIGSALYPTLVYAVTQVQVASLVTLLVVLMLWLAARSARCGSSAGAVACGLAAGLVVLTDPIMFLVAVVSSLIIACGLAVQASGRELDRPARDSGTSVLQAPFAHTHSVLSRGFRAVLALSICGAVVSPWIVRNHLVHGEFVFVKSTFGYAFWQGNHSQSYGTDKIPLARSGVDEPVGWGLRALERSLWRTRMIDTMYIDDAVLPNERITELGQYSEPERSRRLLADATGYLADHPGHYFRLCLQRLRFFLLFDETNPKSRVPVYRASHLALQMLAVSGLWFSRRHWRRLWPTYVIFALITAFHSLTIISARFHIPLEPIQILWVACGFAELIRRKACAND